MACFLVPAAEAIVTTIVTKVVKSTEKEEKVKISLSDGTVEEVKKVKFSAKLKWLSNLLWGGSALLAFEHIWHGEVVPFFPFLSSRVHAALRRRRKESKRPYQLALLYASITSARRWSFCRALSNCSLDLTCKVVMMLHVLFLLIFTARAVRGMPIMTGAPSRSIMSVENRV